MRTMKFKLFLIVSIFVGFTTNVLLASTMQQMSFEEVTAQADVVILGTVFNSPAKGRFDASGKHVIREHQVKINRYLKGDGAGEITVVTLGGQVEVDILGESSTQEIAYLGHPQLPEEGTEVLLFLKRYGSKPDTFLIYSASHGVIQAQVSSDGNRWVSLIFKDPRIMPSGSRVDFDRAQDAGYSGKTQVFGDTVKIDDLDLLVQIALGKDDAAAAPRIQSFCPPEHR